MKIVLYIGTAVLGLLVCLLMAAAMGIMEEDPTTGSALPLFAVSASLLGLLASGWWCASAGNSLRVFLVRTVGISLCLAAIIFWYLLPGEQLSPLTLIVLFSLGCALLRAMPRFSGMNLLLGFIGGAGIMVGLALTCPLEGEAQLLPGIIAASVGGAILLIDQKFNIFITILQGTGLLIAVASLVFGIQFYLEGNQIVFIGMILVLIVGMTLVTIPVFLRRSKMATCVGRATRSLDEIYQAMSNCDTLLGKPWMCHIPLMGKSIILGPTQSGAYIYFSQVFGNILFGFAQTTIGMKPEPEDTWRLNGLPMPDSDRSKIWAYSLELVSFNDAMIESVRAYLQTGTFTPPRRETQQGTLYTFTENFSLLTESFDMQTMQGKKLYTIDAPLPLITFTIRDAQTRASVLVIKKCYLRMRQQYQFFWNDKLYGTFAKELDLMDDIFTMSTPDGTLTMHGLTGGFGSNYVVSLENRIIGSIASNLTPQLANIVFDNYLIQVQDAAYTPILAGLAAMAAREKARDLTKFIRTAAE